jgi:two-component system, chemotaxis family, protein-glutamate methylesterase/glutaminase
VSTLERADGTRNIVVVGASAGGVEAITQLVAGLPLDFPAAIFVVLHVPPTGSVLPQILARAGSLDARHAADGDEIHAGCIFVAPPDRHLLLDSEAMRVISGPKENGHRPAIDPLFRTAAAAHGTHVAAVILSGSLEDGTAGLQAVKRAGGTTIVQDPDEAHYRAMPDSAIRLTSPDHVLRIDEISELLVRAYDDTVATEAARVT